MKAFPVISNGIHEEGMDVRDYFAAKAMQALINNKSVNKTVAEIRRPDVLPKLVSGMAYELADAMMVARHMK